MHDIVNNLSVNIRKDVKLCGFKIKYAHPQCIAMSRYCIFSQNSNTRFGEKPTQNPIINHRIGHSKLCWTLGNSRNSTGSTLVCDVTIITFCCQLLKKLLFICSMHGKYNDINAITWDTKK